MEQSFQDSMSILPLGRASTLQTKNEASPDRVLRARWEKRVMLARQIQQPGREIAYRTRGRTHGPITRLVSPSDLGSSSSPSCSSTSSTSTGKLGQYRW